MNVVRLENARAPTLVRGGRGGKRRRIIRSNRDEMIVTDNQVTTNLLPKYDLRRDGQPLVKLAASGTTTINCCTVTPKNNRRNHQTTSSSSFRRSAQRSRGAAAQFSSGGQTSFKTCSTDPEHCVILAITSGRGEARGEVGMAAIDLVYPHMILSQISDSNTYTNTLTRIHILNPVEIIMPDTMCERSTCGNSLHQAIQDKFTNVPLTSIPRVHFHDSSGIDRIRTHCAHEFSTVELFVKQKYYALAAAAAVFKYVEYIQHIVYAPKSMRIEFQGSQNTTIIDIDSAQSLELVTSEQSGGSGKSSLLGALDRCSTPMGHRLIRASILQPPCDTRLIKNRQECVAEFVSNRSFQLVIRPVIKRLYGASRLLSLAVMTCQADSVQAAEKNLNYVLLLKNIIDVVPELRAILESGQAEFFKKVAKELEDPRFESINEKILKVINPEARSVMGYTSSNMQRCFAIRAGLNDTLDLARQMYCEIIDDMQKLVEDLSEHHNVELSLGCNANLGYHIEMRLARPRDIKTVKPPEGLIEIERERKTLRMTSEYLLVMDQQCRSACEELHVMSNVLLNGILNEVRAEDIGCLLMLNDEIGELDLLLSMAEISSIKDYTKPEFGRELDLRESRHPVMDITGGDAPVSNDVKASSFYNLHTITGPNMSGKSIYLKQIVLLQIMAQMGCYVPAKTAKFRVADRIFCKMCTREDIETNASTFTLEMRESQYIMHSITATSLVILDELCQGTTVEEGTSLAWAICEKLLRTTAFIFTATHFIYLTRLSDIYNNVSNYYLKTESNVAAGENSRLVYTHKIEPGVLSIWNYGIGLAGTTGLPETIVTRAKIHAKEIARTITPSAETYHHHRSGRHPGGITKTFYDLLADMSQLLNKGQFTVFNVVGIVNKYRIPELVRELRNSSRGEEDDEYHHENVTIEAEITNNQMLCSESSKRDTSTTPTTMSLAHSIVNTDDNKESTLMQVEREQQPTGVLARKKTRIIIYNERRDNSNVLYDKYNFFDDFENNNKKSTRMDISSDANDTTSSLFHRGESSSTITTGDSLTASHQTFNTLSQTSKVSSEATTFHYIARTNEQEAAIFRAIQGSDFQEDMHF